MTVQLTEPPKPLSKWLSQNATFQWTVVRREMNAGVSVARNAGFDQIGELPFVCFLDSDDLWPPNFIAEGLRALDEDKNAIAAVADRVKRRRNETKRVESLHSVATNPLLWVICHDGGILSCTMIRSHAARAAGLFTPGMLASEDSDFLLRLFLLGGATHSEADPVLFIKSAPLETTEPPNLSSASPYLKYLWARHLTHSVLRLPKPVFKEHQYIIRSAVARRWADAAYTNRRAGRGGQAINCLLQAFWWDYRWRRRLKLLRGFRRGRNGVSAHYRTGSVEI